MSKWDDDFGVKSTVTQYLGLSESDIEQEGKNEKERRLEALQKWKDKFGFEAVHRKLVEVLLSLSVADVAGKVCRLLIGTVVYKWSSS